jgi:hypothetical protein
MCARMPVILPKDEHPEAPNSSGTFAMRGMRRDAVGKRTGIEEPEFGTADRPPAFPSSHSVGPVGVASSNAVRVGVRSVENEADEVLVRPMRVVCGRASRRLRRRWKLFGHLSIYPRCVFPHS